MSITSADVSRQQVAGVSLFCQEPLRRLRRHKKGGEKMGHTAIPILMAALSCCVWKNVEVRKTHDVSHLKGWRNAISTLSMSAERWATMSRFNVVTSTSHDRLTPSPVSLTRTFIWARFNFRMHPVSTRVMTRKGPRKCSGRGRKTIRDANAVKIRVEVHTQGHAVLR